MCIHSHTHVCIAACALDCHGVTQYFLLWPVVRREWRPLARQLLPPWVLLDRHLWLLWTVLTAWGILALKSGWIGKTILPFQTLIILHSQSQIKVWLIGDVWRKCWFGLENNIWAHLQIRLCLTVIHIKVGSGFSVGDVSQMWGKLRYGGNQLQLEELYTYAFG